MTTDLIAVTGHRPNKLNNEYDGIGKVSDYIRAQFKTIIELYKPIVAISGMALGVDMLWAEVALSMHMDLWAAIPCKGQTAKWPTKSVNRWRNILSDPRTTVMYNPGFDYGPGVMQARNQWMVQRCDLLIAVYDGSNGGTKNCVDYAMAIGRKIHHIDLKPAMAHG